MIASAQILGWLAFPARPLHGVNIIQQWHLLRRRARGFDDVPPIRLDKPNRLQQRIDTLDAQIIRRLKVGNLLADRISKEVTSSPNYRGNWRFGRGLNEGIRRMLREPDLTQTGNATRDYWMKSLPVIHLAKASLFAILDAYRTEGREGWHLERTIFWADWVAQAIAGSEGTATLTARLGLVDHATMIRFYRD